jgi:hypothetical protein
MPGQARTSLSLARVFDCEIGTVKLHTFGIRPRHSDMGRRIELPLSQPVCVGGLRALPVGGSTWKSCGCKKNCKYLLRNIRTAPTLQPQGAWCRPRLRT